MSDTLDNFEILNSGKHPSVFMDIGLKNNIIGTIYIELFRDIYPAAVENFIGICKGKTFHTDKLGYGKYKYRRVVKRSYENCKFYNKIHDNYLATGDIYNNDGTDGGTIFNDISIPAIYPDEFYPHDRTGLISLIPYVDENTGRYYFDSNFMITLDEGRPENLLNSADEENLVIGKIYSGLNVIETINNSITPFNGSAYPEYYIAKCGLNVNTTNKRRTYPPIAPDTSTI
jgi:cyclophilin family peptidyl-prolyl cis-trans isomerase